MLWDFLSQVYKLPLLVFKRAMANPMGVFVYGILSKWYILVMIAAVTVTFWVFKGLEKAGVLEAAEKEVKYGLLQAQAIAQHCVPLIMDLPKMWDCIQQTTGDHYNPTADDEALKNSIQNDLQDSRPYNSTPATDSRSSAPGADQHGMHPDNPPEGSNPYDTDVPAITYDDGIIRTDR